MSINLSVFMCVNKSVLINAKRNIVKLFYIFARILIDCFLFVKINSIYHKKYSRFIML